MPRPIPVLGCLILAAVVGPTTAFASSITVRADLDAKHEVPAQSSKAPHAVGLLAGALVQTKSGYELAWRLTYSKTSGVATFANIQDGTATRHGTVIVFLCGPCKSGAHGKVYTSPGEASLLREGRLYVNLTTKRNPAG